VPSSATRYKFAIVGAVVTVMFLVAESKAPSLSVTVSSTL